MSQEVDKNIVKAIVEIAVFLEFSGGNAINQDSAVQAMEQLASTLNDSSIETKSSLAKQFEEIAKDYTGEEEEFIHNLADSLGFFDA